MANGAQAKKKVQPGQLNQVNLAPGDLDFCLTQPRILFDSAGSFVTPDADHKRVYQSVLQRLSAGAGRLLVVGHTDDVGQPSDNDPLSERRARAALAVLTGNAGDWESIFATERWGNNEFQTMLTEVGMPADAQSIRQHRELTSAGRARRATLFGQYFLKLLGNPPAPTTVTSLSPPSLGCGEQHVIARGDHRPSRRAEFFFFNGSSTSAVDCRLYPTWLNPCPPIPLPVPTRNAFFVSGAGDDATGDGSSAQPWRTIRHALAQVAVRRRSGQHITLNVLAGLYFENVILPSETTLESTATPKPEIRGVPFTGLPTIQIAGSRNSNVKGLNVTRGGRSGIRIDQQARNITIRGCQIADNFAPRGGGVAIVDAIDVTLDDCVTERNEAGTIQTAVLRVDIDAAITSGEIETFDIQVGDAHGGGVYVENSDRVFIRNNRIRDNQAILFGGGIAVDNRPGFNGEVEISDNEITCNQCSHGGLGPLNVPGINCTAPDINDLLVERMKEETFDEVAERAVNLLHGLGIESGMGGGIALRHVSRRAQLLRNRIGDNSRPNRARRGGGIECFIGAYPLLIENSIEFNLTSDDGGGISIDQFDPFLPRSQPTFLSFRRGIIFPRQTIELIDNRIRFNQCISDGGGLYATGNARVEIRGRNTIIAGNRSGENGGGIRVSYAARLTINGARISGNQSNTIGTERDGGGGIAARNAEVRLQDCELSGNIANNFAGGAIFCTSAFEGGFNRSGFVGNQFGQFDEIMRDDYGLGVRRYHFTNARGSGNQATGPTGNSSGAGGFMYCVRVEGDLPIEILIRGSGTAIGPNTSTFERSGNRDKRGNVVLELSGRQRSGHPEDRVFIAGDVPSVASGGIVNSTPAPDNHPVVVLRGPGQPIDRPTTFPYFFGSPPNITDAQPRFGPIAGGTGLLITGQDFLAGAEVEIGGALATVTDVTETTITVTTPPGALGAFDVLARNPDGQTDVVRGGFEYVRPPSILDVQPRSGTPAGGTPITVTGTDFRPGVRVLIGGQHAANVNLGSDTEITATTPPSPGMIGSVDVVVENADGQSDSVSGGFTYQVSSPRIIDVRPRSGPSTLATRVTMTGTDFLPGAQLLIGGQLATGITVVPPTEIVADTPIQPTVSGFVDVEVRNPDSGADLVRGGFEYIPPPTIVDVQPGSGPAAGGTLITITGTDFQPGAQVLIDGRPATVVPLGSTVEIIAITPPLPIPVLPGPVDVRVENPDGQEETVPGGFTYTP